MADVPPSKIIYDLLDDAGTVIVSDPDTAWSAHISKTPATPHAVISIFDTGGFNPNPAIQIDQVTVQVLVRGEPSGYLAAYQKAQDIKDVLLGALVRMSELIVWCPSQ